MRIIARSVLLLPLLGALLTPCPAAVEVETTVPIAPALVGLEEHVALTALRTTLGDAAALLSEQSSFTIIADPRYRDRPVSLAHAEGPLGEVLSALCLATGMEARRLERWIVLAPSSEGIAVIARHMRAEQAPRLTQERQALAARREAAVARARARLGVDTPAQARTRLDPQQLAVLGSQGYLTVAQLLPRYYHPLYDYFSYGMYRELRPPTLPEFAGTPAYLEPMLRLELRIPAPPGIQETLWPIDVISGEKR